jgi:hypothetical protein
MTSKEVESSFIVPVLLELQEDFVALKVTLQMSPKLLNLVKESGKI